MKYNWQQKGWPRATVNRAALRDELAAFEAAFLRVGDSLRKQVDAKTVAVAMADEAIKTSAIEGVRVDETVVMSSICRALGMPTIPLGFTRDVRAEGVAQMVLAVKRDWKRPIGAALMTDWHAALLANDNRGLRTGAFRQHPVQVIRRDAYGEIEVMFEAPPSERVPREISSYCRKWRAAKTKPADVALKAAMLHPHFESIHPFDDGNGRVGRALVAKLLAKGLGVDVVLPVSTVIMRHRKDYYEEIHKASQSLDWTDWAKFFIPILTETLTNFITATRDLEELEKAGAIIREGESVATRYRLNFEFREPLHEPLSDPINDPINEPLHKAICEAVKSSPGINREGLASRVGKSVETVKRAIAALVKAGKVEHRGSKKTGGYWKK